MMMMNLSNPNPHWIYFHRTTVVQLITCHLRLRAIRDLLTFRMIQNQSGEIEVLVHQTQKVGLRKNLLRILKEHTIPQTHILRLIHSTSPRSLCLIHPRTNLHAQSRRTHGDLKLLVDYRQQIVEYHRSWKLKSNPHMFRMEEILMTCFLECTNVIQNWSYP